MPCPLPQRSLSHSPAAENSMLRLPCATRTSGPDPSPTHHTAQLVLSQSLEGGDAQSLEVLCQLASRSDPCGAVFSKPSEEYHEAMAMECPPPPMHPEPGDHQSCSAQYRESFYMHHPPKITPTPTPRRPLHLGDHAEGSQPTQERQKEFRPLWFETLDIKRMSRSPGRKPAAFKPSRERGDRFPWAQAWASAPGATAIRGQRTTLPPPSLSLPCLPPTLMQGRHQPRPHSLSLRSPLCPVSQGPEALTHGSLALESPALALRESHPSQAPSHGPSWQVC